MLALTPELWGTIILVAGGCIFAACTLVAAKTAFRSALEGPELRGRMAECEARLDAHARDIKTAVDAARKARRIASTRKERAPAPAAAPAAPHHAAPYDPFAAGPFGQPPALPAPRGRAPGPEPTDEEIVIEELNK